MQISIKTALSNEPNIMVFCYEACCINGLYTEIFEKLSILKLFSGKPNQVYTYTDINDDIVKRIIFVGLGKKDTLKSEGVRTAAAAGIRESKKFRIFSLMCDLRNDQILCDEGTYVLLKNIVEASIMTVYKYQGYHQNEKDNGTYDLNLILNKKEPLYEKAVNEGKAIGEGVILARDMINEPPNYLTPERIATLAVETFKDSDVKVEIYDEHWLQEHNFNGLYEVGKSSEYPPRLVLLTYQGSDSKNFTAIVGKGVTFDSGGYNLKKSAGLEFMKSDMGGGAAALGLMKVISQVQLDLNVIVAIPTCENMIDGKSYRAGDILTTQMGKTVEIVNTDAEGRLILADTLAYLSNRENVDEMIDIATLTGNSAAVFGGVCASVMSNDDQLYERLSKSSKRTNEVIWRLPLFDAYKRYLISDVADIKNTSSGKFAGSILGGTFLKEFVGTKKWIHIDMASTNASMMASGYHAKGAKGYGVRLLYDFLKTKVINS